MRKVFDRAKEGFRNVANEINTALFELVSRKVSAWSVIPNDTNYPTEKLVYDSLLGYAKLAVTQSFTKAQRVSVVALTSSSNSIALDLALSNNFSHTLTENTTLANPGSVVAGQKGSIYITQHASAAKTFAVGSNFLAVKNANTTISATLSSKNLLVYEVFDASTIVYAIYKLGTAS